jgi:hypothetical protein
MMLILPELDPTILNCKDRARAARTPSPPPPSSLGKPTDGEKVPYVANSFYWGLAKFGSFTAGNHRAFQPEKRQYKRGRAPGKLQNISSCFSLYNFRPRQISVVPTGRPSPSLLSHWAIIPLKSHQHVTLYCKIVVVPFACDLSKRIFFSCASFFCINMDGTMGVL